MTGSSTGDSLPPRSRVMQIVGNALLARALGIVAEFGIADLLTNQPLHIDQLAKQTRTNADALYRLMRYLASNQFFSEDDQSCFHMTPLASVLRKGEPDSLHDIVRLGWQDVTWDTYRELPHTIRTGEPAFTKAYGAEFFDYLEANPTVSVLFDASMALFSEPENDVIAKAYDFGNVSRVVDIGGGQGGLLAAVLQTHDSLKGILFDQEQVLTESTALHQQGLTDRCEFIAGNFFEAVPAGADVYLLKRILHDWDDGRALVILKTCAQAMGPHSRLLIIDAVIRPGNAPDSNKAMDVGIMALTPGRERTEGEFRALCDSAGLELDRIIATERPSTLSIVEAKKA